MLLLSKSDIKKVFSMREAVEADKEAFQLFSEGKSEVPLRTNIQVPRLEALFCSCLLLWMSWIQPA